MITRQIPLDSFNPRGSISANIDNGELHISTRLKPKNQCACTNNKFKLPFRIDMTLKVETKTDYPVFNLVIGKGHVSFAGGGIRRTDILTGENKPAMYVFDNHVPKNEYFDISVMYGSKMMWVIINGEYRYFSDKMPYIKMIGKNTAPAELSDGLNFALYCERLMILTVKSLTVTEYQNDEPDIPAEILNATEISALEMRIKNCSPNLSPELKDEIIKIDEYLLSDMRKSLKFKRTFELYDRISYVSPFGFRYKIYLSNDDVTGGWHNISWIAYNTEREQQKFGFQKADYTVETLNKLAEASPEFANEIFDRMKECVKCRGRAGCTGHSSGIYEFNGKRKRFCCGFAFKMIPSDFVDVKRIIHAISKVIDQNR